MLTSKDIKKLLEVLATKQELHELREDMVGKKEFDEKFDGVMNKLDAVYGEVKDMRQEQQAHQGQHDRISERLEKFEANVSTF